RVLAHQVLLQRSQRPRLTSRRAATGDHAPALRDGVYAALHALPGAQRRAIIEVGAPVPVAIPAVLLDGQDVGIRLRTELGGKARVTALLHMPREGSQVGRQEPGQPHALAATLNAHATHAVVPVADADQRQSV